MEELIGSPVAIVMALIVANERFVEALFSRIFEHFKWNTEWLMYIAWVTGAVLVWLSQINLFAGYIPNELAGKIITAIVAGGGSNLLHVIFSAVNRTTRNG